MTPEEQLEDDSYLYPRTYKLDEVVSLYARSHDFWETVIVGMNLPPIEDLIDHLTLLGLQINYTPFNCPELNGLAMCNLSIESPAIPAWRPFGMIPQVAAQGLLWGLELQINGLAPVKSDLIHAHLLAQQEQKHAD